MKSLVALWIVFALGGSGPLLVSAAAGYCSGTATPCGSVYSSITCTESDFSDSCPLIVETCEVICERAGATDYDSPCRCILAPLGCSGGSFDVCEKRVACTGLANCDALTSSLDCLFMNGCDWTYGSRPPTLSPTATGSPSSSTVPTARAGRGGAGEDAANNSVGDAHGEGDSNGGNAVGDNNHDEDSGGIDWNDGEEDSAGSDVVIDDTGEEKYLNESAAVIDAESIGGDIKESTVDDNDGGVDVGGSGATDIAKDVVDTGDGVAIGEEKDAISDQMDSKDFGSSGPGLLGRQRKGHCLAVAISVISFANLYF